MAISRLRYISGVHSSAGSYESVVPMLDARLLDRIEPLFEMSTASGGSGAPSLSYSRLPDGSALISNATGAAANALFLEQGAAELGELLPVDLWRSPVWERWDATSGSSLPTRRQPQSAALADFAEKVENQKKGRLERFLAEVHALFAPAPGRQIVLIADPDDVANFVRLACASLPAQLAVRLTFTTRCGDPHAAIQQIVGTPTVPVPAFSPPEAQFQYRVHDLFDGSMDSPEPDVPDEWACSVARKWLDGALEPAQATRLWHAPRVPDEQIDPLSRMSAWPTPAAPALPNLKPALLFAKLRDSSQEAANALRTAAGVALGDIPDHDVEYLSKRIRDDADFARACVGPLSALEDTRLPSEMLRHLDRGASGLERETLLAPGFQSVALSPLGALAPQDCVRLRILVAAARAGLAGSTPDAGFAPTVDASAREIVQLVRTAQLTPVPGEDSPLTTALALYWPRARAVWDTGAIPARAVLAVLDGLAGIDNGLVDQAVLDRFTHAALMAPVVDQDVIDLAARLITLQPGESQENALTVLIRADRFDPGQDIVRTRLLLDDIRRALRSRDGVKCSAAVRIWWIRRALDALFRGGSDESWIDAVPELAGCDDEDLLAQYQARVCESPERRELLARSPELLDRAVSAWILAPHVGSRWLKTRGALLDWASRLHRSDQAVAGR